MYEFINFDFIQLWVSYVTVLFLITYEFTSPSLGYSLIKINRNNLRNVTLGFIVLFVIVYSVKIYVRFLV